MSGCQRCNPTNTKKCQGVKPPWGKEGKEGKEGIGDPEGAGYGIQSGVKRVRGTVRGKEGEGVRGKEGTG